MEKKIFNKDPFVSIDQPSVGSLVDMSSRNGKKANRSLKIGICGEHAGDPNSIFYLNTLDIDYISCSPYRIPAARLAAAGEGNNGLPLPSKGFLPPATAAMYPPNDAKGDGGKPP